MSHENRIFHHCWPPAGSGGDPADGNSNLERMKSVRKQDFISFLESLNACSEAVSWCDNQSSAQRMWNTCKRGDWMLWLLAKTTDRKTVVSIACQCARLALKYVPEGENRPRIAIETAEKWCKDRATIEEVRIADAAASAAYAAASAACAADAAASAAYAAASAACAAADAADAAYAAYAAASAAYAASATASAAADAADAARSKVLIRAAKIARKYIPKVPTKVAV